MDESRSRFIRGAARDAAVEVYLRRYSFWRLPPSSPLGMIELPVIAKVFGARYHEPVEIVAFSTEIPGVALPVRYAGYMDPDTNTVAVARNLPPSMARFTGAHEFGHLVLHKDQGVLYRDLPLSGDERSDRQRPVVEQEADLFAAELLIPEKIVRQTFSQYFHKESFYGVKPDEDTAHWLSTAHHEVTPAKLEARGRRYLALLLANSAPWTANREAPTHAELFRVSKVAMAIQFELLGLV